MSHAVLSLLYARLGDQKRATEVFARAYQPNKLPPFGFLAETAGGTNPYFAIRCRKWPRIGTFGFAQSWTSLTLKGIGP